MQLVPRAFLALAVLFWLISVPLFSRLASAAGPPPGHSGDDQGDEGGDGATRTGRCGSDPGDTDELASVRATAADQCDCAGAGDHGRYVNCVAHVADAAVRSGSLRKACRDSVMRCAAKSVCGKKDSVTCCRTDARGNAKCSIKHSATECKAPHGGTACVGQVAGERAGLLDALHTGDRDGPGGLLARAEVARRADQGRGSGGERARPVT